MCLNDAHFAILRRWWSPPSFLKILHLKMAEVGTAIGNGEGRSRTYGTCFQDCDFKVAGRLITMRPLLFFGPGKFMNLDTMTECANARNDAKQKLAKGTVSHVVSVNAKSQAVYCEATLEH